MNPTIMKRTFLFVGVLAVGLITLGIGFTKPKRAAISAEAVVLKNGIHLCVAMDDFEKANSRIPKDADEAVDWALNHRMWPEKKFFRWLETRGKAEELGFHWKVLTTPDARYLIALELDALLPDESIGLQPLRRVDKDQVFVIGRWKTGELFGAYLPQDAYRALSGGGMARAELQQHFEMESDPELLTSHYEEIQSKLATGASSASNR